MGKSNTTANSEVLSIVEQRTEMSSPAPVRHPGQPLHEVVFALPLLNMVKSGLEKSPLLLAYQLKSKYYTLMNQKMKLILCMESLIMQYYREQKYCHFSAEKFG